ncbi:hypothetical protein P7K49_015230 [Saguinus oedipus]|uniref:Secreted protein n=1 Tax=Saguinus oedipus TaxID=9490 RepID=A0ABQ9V8M8_SAGOE|nr:hypothetical protein P7K49_015230 [Saguinus oedipus]
MGAWPHLCMASRRHPAVAVAVATSFCLSGASTCPLAGSSRQLRGLSLDGPLPLKCSQDRFWEMVRLRLL